MAAGLFRRKIKGMARAAMELARAVNGGSLSNQRRPRESDVADLGRSWERCAVFARCSPVLVRPDVSNAPLTAEAA
jgi:hypothetical protein